MAYLYPAMVAFTSNGNSVVKNAVFQVYAPGDTAFANPLAITDNQGNALSNLNSGSQGVFPAFQQAQYTTVVVSDVPNHQYAWTVPAALTGAVLQWASNTYYAQGTAVVNPNGDLVTANTAHTSGTSYTASNWTVKYTAKTSLPLNILDYGVTTGTTASQTAAIKAALDGNPGRAFYFPPGSYRLDTGLVIGNANTLVLDKDARLYAGAAMTTLIQYAYTGSGYAEDKGIIGGTLDGNLNATNILTLATVLRFTLTQVTFVDGIQRGLVTQSGPGAEVFAYDLRFKNTGTSNVSNNVAIEANMSDCHFRDIVTRDWTTGVKDTGGNKWTDIHPWISPDVSGGLTQTTARFPSSVGFNLTGASDLIRCYSDTMRTGFLIAGTSGTTQAPRLHDCLAYFPQASITAAIALANPYYAVDNSAGVGAYIDNLNLAGSANGAGSVLNGTVTTGLTMTGTTSYGFMNGALTYWKGVAQDSVDFTPTLIGSTTAGSASYSFQSGRMTCTGDTITYTYSITCTTDATIAGNYRIGGLPIPAGAATNRNGTGEVGYASNIAAYSAIMWAGNLTGSTTTITPLGRDASGNSIELATATSKAVQIHGKVVVIVSH